MSILTLEPDSADTPTPHIPRSESPTTPPPLPRVPQSTPTRPISLLTFHMENTNLVVGTRAPAQVNPGAVLGQHLMVRVDEAPTVVVEWNEISHFVGSDDVPIAAPLSLLAKYSPFFESLSTIPPPCTKAGITSSRSSTTSCAIMQVIPLPHATSRALQLVVRFLTKREVPAPISAQPIHRGLISIDPVTCIETIEEINQIADTYDMSIIIDEFCIPVYDDSLRTNPILAFAIAAVLGSESHARIAAHRTIRGDIPLIPRGIDDLLFARYTVYSMTLRHLHLHVSQTRTKLFQALQSEEPMLDRLNTTYGRICKWDDGKINNHRCPNVSAQRTFEDVRNQADRRQYETIIHPDFSLPRARQGIRVDVGCSACSTRLAWCFWGPAGDYCRERLGFKFVLDPHGRVPVGQSVVRVRDGVTERAGFSTIRPARASWSTHDIQMSM